MKSYRWTEVTLNRGNIQRVKRVRLMVTWWGNKKIKFRIFPIWKDTSKLETLASFSEAITKKQFSLRCFVSFRTSRKSCNFVLLFKMLRKWSFAPLKLSSWSEHHCVTEILGSYYSERSKIHFLMNQKYQKCSSQLFDIFNHAVSRFPFIIRSTKRKLSLPKLQGMFHITIKGFSRISSVDRQ